MATFVVGFLLATIGITFINCLCEVISAATELFKSTLSVKIVKNNDVIKSLQAESTSVKAIGFDTTFEEEEEEDDY